MIGENGSMVLVVGDEPAVRKFLCDVLTRAGFGCAEAADGESGLKLALEADVSAAVVDLILPGMNGAELAWRLGEEIPGLPVVAVSGRLDLWDTDDLEDLGIRVVLHKPFEPEKLVRAVAGLLRHKPADASGFRRAPRRGARGRGGPTSRKSTC